MQDYHQILNKGEQVLWVGRPQFLPWMVGQAWVAVAAMGVFGMFAGLFLYVALEGSGSAPGRGVEANIAFGLIALIAPILAMISVPVYYSLLWFKVRYLLTDKRIVVQKGIVGRDFKTIDYDQLLDVRVNVGIVDKIFGVDSGTLLFTIPSSYRVVHSRRSSEVDYVPTRFVSISQPYTIFKFFKKTSFDVRTDMQFPNALRPEVNAGISTTYSPPERLAEQKEQL